MTGRTVRRGDVYMVDWEPGHGSEQTGYRPSLVIQNDVGNDLGRTTIIAAITTAPRRLHVTVPLGRSGSGLRRNSIVNLAHILTVDKSRLDRYVGRVNREVMIAVDTAIQISLGLRSGP